LQLRAFSDSRTATISRDFAAKTAELAKLRLVQPLEQLFLSPEQLLSLLEQLFLSLEQLFS